MDAELQNTHGIISGGLMKLVGTAPTMDTLGSIQIGIESAEKLGAHGDLLMVGTKPHANGTSTVSLIKRTN